MICGHRRLAIVLLALVLTGCAGAARPVTEPSTAAAAPATPWVGTMRPGDGLRVRIYREPELSGEFAVDDRGMVVLPKLGEVIVSGTRADSLRPMLLAQYKRYLTTDAIEIMPFRRLAVIGAVNKPGLYPIDPSMTIGDAIIVAGGVAPDGRLRAAELRGAGERRGEDVGIEEQVWATRAGGEQQLYVPQRPWLRRNWRAALSVTTSAFAAYLLYVQLMLRIYDQDS